ncbi:MAG: ABC transporter permease [Bacteroidetes bacterium]|nr:ABC transporter permease [Bacteroidota bacterium]
MRLKDLKLFIHYLSKNKLFTIITLFSFSIALTYVILLGVYLQNELSVDAFQQKKDRIFRIHNESSFAPKVGSVLMEKYPEIENYTRLDKQSLITSTPGGIKRNTTFLLVDSSFFTVFSFRLVEGDPSSVLDDIGSVVLSRHYATRLFGNKPAKGREIIVDGKWHLTVTGVVEDFTNTQIEPCDAIINFNMLARFWNYPELLTTYDNSSFNLYFLEKPGTDLAAKAPEILKFFKQDYWMYKNGITKTLDFIPLEKAYFIPVSGHGGSRSNSLTFIRILFFIILFVLLIALLNYVNLSIAQAGFRAKEAALKKLAGSSRSALLLQFVSESILLCLVSFGIAIFLSFLIEPFANQLLETKLMLADHLSFPLMAAGFVFIMLLGIIAGLAPALVITRFSPIDIVKGTFRRKSKLVYSKVLISIQYFIALVLLICTMVIVKQTRFLVNYDVGFQKENIAYFDNYITDSSRVEPFINELKKDPAIQEVSFVQGSPMDGGNNNTLNIGEGKVVSYQTFAVDSAFYRIMKLHITPTGAAMARNGILMNETAIRESGLSRKSVSTRWANGSVPLLGVVDDYLINSLHQKVRPVVIWRLYRKSEAWSVLVKLSGTNLPQTLAHIREVHRQFTDGIEPDIKFFDQTIHSWYKKEENSSRLIASFTLLAIIMSVMGLFAMSLYYIQQKNKEIGIRKISGAGDSAILILLNRDYLKWVLLSFVFAVPVAWYAMHRWLEGFAGKTGLNWWIFALAGLAACFIALMTVGWQSWRAASRNPVEVLRYE